MTVADGTPFPTSSAWFGPDRPARRSRLPRTSSSTSVISKGVENGTLMLMTEVLEDVLGNRDRLAGLSGPNHAEEVGKGVPAATVIAAYDASVGRLFQDLFMTRFFRTYTNPDVIGVELC